jgi:hypothetical protein
MASAFLLSSSALCFSSFSVWILLASSASFCSLSKASMAASCSLCCSRMKVLEEKKQETNIKKRYEDGNNLLIHTYV